MHLRLVILLLLIVPAHASNITEKTESDDLAFLMSDEEQAGILMHFESGTFDFAERTEIIPHLESLCHNLATGLASRGEYEKAIEVLHLIPPESLSRENQILLAFLSSRLGDTNSALMYLNELSIQYPYDPLLDNARSYILVTSGQPDMAHRIQEKVIKQIPDYAPAQDTWGTILAVNGNLKESERYLSYAYQDLSDDAEVLTHLASVKAALGKTADAQDLYQKAVNSDPAYGGGQKEYAALLMKLGRYPEAKKVIRTALRLMPGDAELIAWEQELDAILMTWYVKQEQEAEKPLLKKRVVQVNHS